ncbi:hypothetical protein LguiA_001536 [Lonicera macranthoides]
MIPQLCCHNRSENSILLSLILFVSVLALQIEAMRIHPMKRNLTIRDENETLTLMDGGNAQKKKLRRLPHVFSKVLELPLPSDADVSVEETSDRFRFVADIAGEEISGGGEDVRALAVEIHPGVTKIVIRSGGAGEENDLLLDRLEVDVWRFRLPAFTRPELATAVFVDGELIVTVPKCGVGEVGDGIETWGGIGQLVLVQ